jgi:hypothetical protein
MMGWSAAFSIIAKAWRLDKMLARIAAGGFSSGFEYQFLVASSRFSVVGSR